MALRLLILIPADVSPLAKITPLLVHALEAAGCLVTTAPWGRTAQRQSLVARALDRFRTTAKVLRLLNRNKYDLLVVTTTHDWGTLLRDIPLTLLARKSARPTILQFHGSSPNKLARPGALVFKLATRILIWCSNASLVLCTEELAGWQEAFPQSRFFMVDNPFLVSPEVSEAACAAVRAFSTACPIILFVGRLISEKGPMDLLQAFSLVRKEMSCKLLLVGGGPLAPALRARVAELNLEEDVELAGFLKGDDLNAVYRRASVFALPTYYDEGFPTVIAEAMAAGLPVITTPVRGAVDHLLDGVNAVFVPPQEPIELAAALRRLLTDPKQRERIGQANRRKVGEFAPEKVVGRYLDIFAEVIGDGPATSSKLG